MQEIKPIVILIKANLYDDKIKLNRISACKVNKENFKIKSKCT